MNICPITYTPCEKKYSDKGVKALSRSIKSLRDLPLTSEEQIVEAAARAPKMSIQGVQPKLSAVLKPSKGIFEIVDTGGRYILKPQNPQYRFLPENEDLSMRLAQTAGVEVPFHGLIYSKDGSMTYFIRRFDRIGKKKLAVEDFSQLLGLSRDTKYNSSMEKVARVIDEHCTFPMVEKVKLFKLTLVNFLVGNEDMHVKNFSLMTQAGKVMMTPAYDILNTTLALSDPQEEIALPIGGKKRKLDREILIEYFGHERLGLNWKTISSTLANIEMAQPNWLKLIQICFLPRDFKEVFSDLVRSRQRILFS